MKHIKLLVVSLICLFILAGCSVSPTAQPVQPEVNAETQAEDINYDWWVNKQYKSDSGDIFQAVYHKSNNVLAFCSVKTGVNLITDYDRLPEIDTDNGKQLLRYSDEIRKGNELINATYVVYYPEIDTVTMIDLKGNVCDTYTFYKNINSKDAPENTTIADSTDVLKYECYDTQVGQVTLSVTGLTSSADWVDLYFVCENCENDYTLAIPRDELKNTDWMKYTYNTASSVEDKICLNIYDSQLDWNASGEFELFNGSYIQLPDAEE